MKQCVKFFIILCATAFLVTASVAQNSYIELTARKGEYSTSVSSNQLIDIGIKTGIKKPLLVKLEYDLKQSACCLNLFEYSTLQTRSNLFSLCDGTNGVFTTIVYDTNGAPNNASISLKAGPGASGALKITYSLLDEDLSEFYLSYGYDHAGNRTSVNIHEVKLKNGSNANIDENEPLADDLFGEREIKIFPNPTKGDLNILIQDGESEEQYQYLLYDLNGRKLMEFSYSGNGMVPLNLHSYNSGTYILVIRTTDGDLKYKIIKE